MTVFMTVVMIVFMTALMTHDHLKPLFDIVLLEHVCLPHVLPLAVHLVFFCVEQVEGVILSHSYSLIFHDQWGGGVVVGP